MNEILWNYVDGNSQPMMSKYCSNYVVIFFPTTASFSDVTVIPAILVHIVSFSSVFITQFVIFNLRQIHSALFIIICHPFFCISSIKVRVISAIMAFNFTKSDSIKTQELVFKCQQSNQFTHDILLFLRRLCHGPVVNGPISIGLRTKYEKKNSCP